MKMLVGLVGVVACAFMPPVVWGDDHVRYALPDTGLVGKPPCKVWPFYNGCCPDDYCPKSLPVVHGQKWCAPDDYDRKPLPPCPPWSPLGCDDYDCKKCKILIGVPCTPFDTCGPPEGCCKDRCRPWQFWLH